MMTIAIFPALQSSNKQDTSKRRYTDFLDTLLLARDDEGQGLDDVEIREEVDTFLFAGMSLGEN